MKNNIKKLRNEIFGILKKGKKIYFASDNHLGAPSREKSLEREKIFVKWLDKIKRKEDDEESMLDQAFDVKNNSRLSCQIDLSEDLDGIELELAPE